MVGSSLHRWSSSQSEVDSKSLDAEDESDLTPRVSADKEIVEKFYSRHPEEMPFWFGPEPKTKWDNQSTIAFLHIGKCGGTSFD